MSTIRYMLIRDTVTDIKVNIFYSAITNQANEGHFTILQLIKTWLLNNRVCLTCFFCHRNSEKLFPLKAITKRS